MTLVLLAAGLRSDASHKPPRGLIAFIGTGVATRDESFAKFEAALRQRHPELARSFDLGLFRASAGDDAGIRDAVGRALQAHARLLVTPTGRTSTVAARLAKGTPLVFATYSDPIASGVRDAMQTSSMATTGVALADQLHAKRLEILRDALPHLREVAVLADRDWVQEYDPDNRLGRMAAHIGLRTTVVLAENISELEALMTDPATRRFDAWYIPPTYIAYLAQRQLIAHLKRLGKPAMHATVGEVEAGAAMAYAQDSAFAYDALADLAARVCQGEFAGAIPVQTPQRFTLALRTDAGDRIAPAVVRRADRVY
ncbi:ABC-type uncharacterized transport system substrate-binding protein [Pelomonas aquatica]|uniref:ABC-type uncharacterized transport system substrate-binding protein n=1 Tax=Pelomonas aquatica TaxID=431058 RepID=A0ABU1Z9K4_9BURK|nr:ABC-type uncharacterized transport system substrate-binding protein [Pelomonas aquatica]